MKRHDHESLSLFISCALLHPTSIIDTLQQEEVAATRIRTAFNDGSKAKFVLTAPKILCKTIPVIVVRADLFDKVQWGSVTASFTGLTCKT